MNLNLDLRDEIDHITIKEYLREIPNELDGDIVGFWAIIADGREGYRLKDADLHEFLALAIGELILHGAHVIVPSLSPHLRWEPTQRYGVSADEIVFKIIHEWNAKGEPNVEAWTTMAFAREDWIQSSENQINR